DVPAVEDGNVLQAAGGAAGLQDVAVEGEGREGGGPRRGEGVQRGGPVLAGRGDDHPRGGGVASKLHRRPRDAEPGLDLGADGHPLDGVAPTLDQRRAALWAAAV